MITVAVNGDIPELVDLINSAYRGNPSRKGWTTEADLIEGDLRIDEETLKQLMNLPAAVVLKYVENSRIEGSVYLEKKANELYLGMLSVNPTKQASGIGKKLLLAAEQHAFKNNCDVITMQVISERKELIDWYKKYGFRDTGQLTAFVPDGKFGIPKHPLFFTCMKKRITS